MWEAAARAEQGRAKTREARAVAVCCSVHSAVHCLFRAKRRRGAASEASRGERVGETARECDIDSASISTQLASTHLDSGFSTVPSLPLSLPRPYCIDTSAFSSHSGFSYRPDHPSRLLVAFSRNALPALSLNSTSIRQHRIRFKATFCVFLARKHPSFYPPSSSSLGSLSSQNRTLVDESGPSRLFQRPFNSFLPK